MITISFSLVLYRHSLVDIAPLLDSLVAISSVSSEFSLHLYVYDNSPSPMSPLLLTDHYPSLEIVHNATGRNIGYGAGHNKNFEIVNSFITSPRDLFVVVNPDISFDSSILEYLSLSLIHI